MQRLSFRLLSRPSLSGSTGLNRMASLVRFGNQHPVSRIHESTTSLSQIERREANSRWPSRLVRRGGPLAVFVAMGLAGYQAFNDLVIYDRCSSKAMETASQDPRLKEALGDEIQRGPWHYYEASLAVSHEGRSASCSFPVCGNQGVANLHLKAMEFRGQWEILMLEALVPTSGSGTSTSKIQKINLMETSDDLKPGDGIGGGSQCISASLQEV